MYKNRTIKSTRVCILNTPTQEFECDHNYHPLSYYLNGGADPTGEHTDMSRVTMSDSAEDLAAGCGVDSRCDPRTSYLDIVEQLGIKQAESAKASMNAGESTEK